MFADRVKETTDTEGTAPFELDGPPTAFQGFVDGIGDGNSCYYAIASRVADEWEVGIGTVSSGSPDTLSRDTILASSNAGSAVSFSSGLKDVFVTYPAGRAVDLDGSGKIPDADVSQSSVTQHEAAIDHDALTNFVANEHIDHSAVSISTGTGLSGGGDLTSTRTLSVDNYADLARLDLNETVSGAWTFNGDVTLGTATDIIFNSTGFRARVESIAMAAVEDLEDELNQVTASFGGSRRLGDNTNPYSISNDTTDRTFDANSTTTAELADVLATLIRDLGRDS